ncbi:MAG: hypothetical protein Q4G07_05565, partial [Oscillospiraceae bacterium]|nr:hypothetical protein [Oscillospiraceae bacterium]
MSEMIPQDLILILSGVPCVGKTTTAYNLIKNISEFRRVSELDIIRTVVRATIKNLAKDPEAEAALVQDKYKALFSSLAENDLDIAKQQSCLLIPYVKEIVCRQQRRKIPTIIEGASIIPSTYFENGYPIKGFEKNILFINLFLSNGTEHYNRRVKRCLERDYKKSNDSIKEEIEIIRKNKNLELHCETVELSKTATNVFSIDIANMNEFE